ncbi:AsnC family transcriptional regulator [Sphingobium sp. HBC34]|uniref:AsnC family transcriptional regulator n=1 Tax=Sphingobium cyanobacteriorum TaxID=3063954 RepID=A0ABT8ZLP0_9SPHN|nr:AsnC family transcriptional regulator [Sphingobium sp. HBC34]MDO7835453.1 AsnC family transcriptional regulator [Sphingobium sp. HBC34]
MSTQIDETNEQIIAALVRDARQSNREVGKALGLSEATVRKRLSRMIDERQVKLTAVCDAAAMGVKVSAIVRLRARPAEVRNVVASVQDLDNVSFVALSAGRFNIMLIVACESRGALASFIHGTLKKRSGIDALEVVEFVDVVKHRLDLILVPKD